MNNVRKITHPIYQEKDGIKEMVAVKEKIRENIVFYLINYSKNKELLLRVPHILYEDMAIVFRYLEEMNHKEIKSMLIGNDFLTQYNLSEGELYACAWKNTPKLFPPVIEGFEKEQGKAKTEEPVFILSNRQKLYGAGVILYDGLLKDFSDRYGWNLFLLPAGIHEFVVLFDRGQFYQDELFEIVKVSNRVMENQRNILSDNVYYYDRQENELYGLF